jgi:hypothetical protein
MWGFKSPLAHEPLTRENPNVAVNDPQAKLDVVTPTALLLRFPLALVLDGNRRIRSSAFLHGTSSTVLASG